jgi:hypothetical protein
MKYSEIIEEAKKFLDYDRDGRPINDGYVCLAMLDVGSSDSEFIHEKSYLRHWIETEQLEGFLSFDAWLEHHHPERYKAAKQAGDFRLRAERLQWMDRMIAYWQSQGD